MPQPINPSWGKPSYDKALVLLAKVYPDAVRLYTGYLEPEAGTMYQIRGANGLWQLVGAWSWSPIVAKIHWLGHALDMKTWPTDSPGFFNSGETRVTIWTWKESVMGPRWAKTLGTFQDPDPTLALLTAWALAARDNPF